MNSSPIKTGPEVRRNEGWLYGLAFLIALGFRFIQLGASPLTDSEATLAVQALQIARGQAPLLGPQPGYILLTSALFAIFHSTNFLARFLPAIMGSLLVFAPYFFRDRIRLRPALILAFLFAIDPGLVALSRQASGTMLAVASLLFAWGMWRNRQLIPAGIFAGLALLSGPSLWAGLLTLGITWIFLQGIQSKPTPEEPTDQSPVSTSPITNYQLQASQYRPAIIALLITLLIGGTLFFLSPNGLSAWLSALPAYLRGWVSASALTPGRLTLTFAAYEILGLFLAAFSLIRGYRTKSPRILRLGLWLGVALLLAIFYRQPSEFVWVIIPLLTLASLELTRAMNIYAEERVEVGVVVLALLILLVYIWFDIAKIGLDPHGQLGSTTLPLFGRTIQITSAPYVILLGASLILILCISFVAFGWSTRTAWLGTVWVFTIFLGVYTLASAWGASRLRPQDGLEFWAPGQPPLQTELLLSTVEDVSEFSLGHKQAQPVAIMGVNSPALEWLLRDRQVDVVSTLDPQFAPPIVITPVMDDLGLPSAYRGQDFTWRPMPRWQEIKNPDWIRWLVFRQLPKDNETIILWARDDLFPDARETSQQP
ncbi:MAG TPA: hypothetical protein VK897_21465 [Anaerolineales bacterium]|nr:hypothetical protein [Anaerolineales bacterium]